MPERRLVYRNQLRTLFLICAFFLGALSLGFFGFMALMAWRWGDPAWVPIGLGVVAVLGALVLPLLITQADTPDYLVLERDSAWAVFGRPERGRRVRLEWSSVTKLHSVAGEYVQIRFSSPEQEGTELIFNLPTESYPALVERTNASRAEP